MTIITEELATKLLELASEYDREPREGEFTTIYFAKLASLSPDTARNRLAQMQRDGLVTLRKTKAGMFWRLVIKDDDKSV